MKKYLLLLVSLLTSTIFFVNGVSAKTHINLGRVYIDYKVLENGIKTFNSYDGNIENMIQYKNNLFEYMNVQSDEDYIIFINVNYKIIEGYKWKKNINFEKEPGLYFGSYSNSIKNNQLRINFNAYVKDKNPIINYFYIPYETTSTGTAGQIYKKDNVYFIQKENNFLSAYFDNNSNNYLAIKENVINKLFHYYESSLDLKFTIDKDLITKGFYDYGFDEVVITDEELKLDLKTYKENDIMFKSNGQNTWENISPEISITTKEKKYTDDKKELLYHSVNINFSIFNTEKYIYQYRTSFNNDQNWTTLQENNYIFKSLYNQTLYVRILQADNGELITSATFTFTGITEDEEYSLPELTYNVNVPKSCYMMIGSNKEIVCKNLDVKIKNYNNLGKYVWEYSTDNKATFIVSYSDDFTLYYDSNKTIYFRLRDVSSGEYIKYETITIAGITTDITSIGPYVTFTGEYQKGEFYYIITAYYYNFDDSLYNFYYSFDRTNWTNIPFDSLEPYSKDSSNKIYKNNFDIHEDCTLYIKIEDKNNNYINAFTFTVNLTKHIEDDTSINRVSEFIDSISDTAQKLSDLLQHFYDNLNKTIQDFLVAVFVIALLCSVVILVRKK